MPKESKNKDNKKVKTNKEKKSFLKDTKAELKKVIWPNGKQLFNNTVAVIVVVLIIGIIVFVLDVCFEKINEFGVDKIKTVVQSNTLNEEESSETTNIEGDDSTSVELVSEESDETSEDSSEIEDNTAEEISTEETEQ